MCLKIGANRMSGNAFGRCRYLAEVLSQKLVESIAPLFALACSRIAARREYVFDGASVHALTQNPELGTLKMRGIDWHGRLTAHNSFRSSVH